MVGGRWLGIRGKNGCRAVELMKGGKGVGAGQLICEAFSEYIGLVMPTAPFKPFCLCSHAS